MCLVVAAEDEPVVVAPVVVAVAVAVEVVPAASYNSHRYTSVNRVRISYPRDSTHVRNPPCNGLQTWTEMDYPLIPPVLRCTVFCMLSIILWIIYRLRFLVVVEFPFDAGNALD